LGYRFFALTEGLAFKSEEDYSAWKNTYKAATFQDEPNSETLFLYREKDVLMFKKRMGCTQTSAGFAPNKRHSGCKSHLRRR
jgi:hypothetical protein